MRRVILAIDRGDLGKLPFSDDVNSQSRLLMRRNIRERVAAVAPFLTFDQDPYMVVGDDGRLSWVMDAFTASSSQVGYGGVIPVREAPVQRQWMLRITRSGTKLREECPIPNDLILAVAAPTPRS